MWFQDCFGRKIELTQERWQHITKEHPELEKLKDRIGGVLSDPDYVKRSKRDDRVELFYKFESDLYRGKFLLVVVKENVRCFLLTAYVTDAIKKGETIYEREPENGLR
jgi:hypothetical protein